MAIGIANFLKCKSFYYPSDMKNRLNLSMDMVVVIFWNYKKVICNYLCSIPQRSRVLDPK